MDNELDTLKKRRLEQLRQNYAEQNQAAEEKQQADAEAAQQMAAIEDAVKAHLSKEALQRYGTLKLAHPETAMQLIIAIARLIEAGRVQGMLKEEQLVMLLKQLQQLQPSRETRIVRR
ncbi:hypothetical protein HYU18_00895 [Candidatus Woesearchaeota archaeon]|nr:hypothetical protein [Candidatus Woesearchaeota archaeon]